MGFDNLTETEFKRRLYQMISSCPSRVERPSPPFLRPQSKEHEGRITLVLDLDETLISNVARGGSSGEISPPDEAAAELDVEGDDKYGNVWRPGLLDFLSFARKHFEVVLFTAGSHEHAMKALAGMGGHSQAFTHRLSAKFILGEDKDLNLLGRDMKKTLIVDDRQYNLDNHPDNGYLIPPFTVLTENDRELEILTEFLRDEILPADDVRVPLRKWAAAAKE